MRGASRVAVRAVGAAGTVGVMLAGGLVPWSPAAAVDTDQTYRVPDSRRLTVQGHGYGHGHGMSQYGAEGAARQGLGHREILAFYYPGTRLRVAAGRIKVWVTAHTSPDLVVGARSGLGLHEPVPGT